MGVDPVVDLSHVESQQVTPLDERDATLLHQAPLVTLGDAQPLGYRR